MPTETIPLKQILPNPWQPRTSEDPEHILEIARSIARDGLLQIPVGRRVKTRIELAAGHTRLAAFRLLAGGAVDGARAKDFAAMPVSVLELDDEAMFRIAVSENVQRRDLTPIEQAQAMLRFRDEFGKTSEQIGELFNLSESAVRNKIRLLNLPEDILPALADGRMSEGAGRAVLSLLELPESLRAKGEKNIHARWSGPDSRPSGIVAAAIAGAHAEDLQDRIDYLINSLGRKLSEAPWRSDKSFEGEGIVNPDCKACPLNIKHGKGNICTDPQCFALKQDLHEAEYLTAASAASGIAVAVEEKSRYDVTTFDGHRNEKQSLADATRMGCPNLELIYADRSPSDYDKHTRVKNHPHAEIVCEKRSGHCTCIKARTAGVALKPANGELEQADLKQVRAEINQARRAAQLHTKGMIDEAQDQIRRALETFEFQAIRRAFRMLLYRFGEAEDYPRLADELAEYMIEKSIYADRHEDQKWLKGLNELLKECGLEPLAVSVETAEPAEA